MQEISHFTEVTYSTLVVRIIIVMLSGLFPASYKHLCRIIRKRMLNITIIQIVTDWLQITSVKHSFSYNEAPYKFYANPKRI